MQESTTQFWCLRTHNYITAIPTWALEKRKQQKMTEQLPPRVSKLEVALGLVLQTCIVYLTWNYGVVAALSVAKSIGILQALALTFFIGFLRARRLSY